MKGVVKVTFLAILMKLDRRVSTTATAEVKSRHLKASLRRR